MTTMHDARPVLRRRRRGPAMMAWGMLALALAVFGVFMYQASGFGAQEESLLGDAARQAPATTSPVESGGKGEQERFAIAGSEVGGFDNDQQPYSIAAVSARQDSTTPNLVHMDQVSGVLRRKDGRKMDVTANSGLFDSREKSLALQGNVTIVLADTFTAHMTAAQVDVRKKSLQSEADVLVELGSGTIFSTGVMVEDNGARVLFRSNVKASFDDDQAGSQAGPDAAAAQAPLASTSTGKGNLQQ